MSYPPVYPPPTISSRAIYHPLFGRLLAFSVCVCFFSLPQTNPSTPPTPSLFPHTIFTPCSGTYPTKTMSQSKPLAPVISPTLHDRPRTNLVPWKAAINRATRAVFAEWDDFGFLFGVCDDAVWAVLNTPPGGVLRDRPEFPAPAALGAGANPAARDVFRRATDSRAAWLACSASFCAAILESIGDANRLAIVDPATDTLHLSPRDIIIAEVMRCVYPGGKNSPQSQTSPVTSWRFERPLAG